MPAPKMSMKKAREVLRLKFEEEKTHRDIAASCRVSPSTVSDCLMRARGNGVVWPLPDEWSDADLEARLYRVEPCAADPRPLPDWAEVHRELKRPKVHVSLQLLWQEYKRSNPDGFEYSWFCERYNEWIGHVEPVMRQTHRFGEKAFVDYAGDKVPVIDAQTGEVTWAQIFVGVLGASNYTFAEASWAQDLPCWIGSHIRMLEFFGGTPRVVVPDNPKPGVTKPDFYEPDLNPTYRELAKHYGFAVIPARVRRPRDKAKVEGAVLIAERWILARIRNLTFYTLDELNQTIAELLVELNRRPFQKLPGCRESVFVENERALLKPLRPDRYEMATWKPARVHLDYHIQVEGHYYSVPYTLLKAEVEVRLAAEVVEVFHNNRRVASHRRSFRKGGATTANEHMPANHRQVADWTPERIRGWAAKTGPNAEAMVLALMDCREHPEQAIRSSLGVLSLGKKFGGERLEAACSRALATKAIAYKSVKNILEAGLDRVSVESEPRPISVGHHENVRGAEYYKGWNA